MKVPIPTLLRDYTDGQKRNTGEWYDTR